MNVRETHWAEGNRKGYDALLKALPATQETHFEEWQERVDRRSELNGNSHHVRTSSLQVFTAIRYESRGGIRQPVEPRVKRTYLVAHEGSWMRASDHVWAHLRAQGEQPSDWVIGSGLEGGVTVLDATAGDRLMAGAIPSSIRGRARSAGERRSVRGGKRVAVRRTPFLAAC
jgi:hypothetical protein